MSIQMVSKGKPRQFDKRLVFARLLFLPTFLAAVLILSGCASSKFTSTAKADLTPFAEQAVVLGAADMEYGFFQVRREQFKDYTDVEGAAFTRFQAFKTLRNQLNQAFMTYSFKIAALSESEKNGPERVEAFADYLQEFGSTKLLDAVFAPARFQQLLTGIRQQETLLDALKAAQPLIDDLVHYSIQLLEEGEQATTALVESIEANIETDFAYALRFEHLLRERKRFALQAIELVLEARPDQLDLLKQALERNELDLQNFLPFSNLTLDDRVRIEELLLKRLELMETIRVQNAPELKKYQEINEELDRVYQSFLEQFAKSRMRLLIWTRAHQKIAAGVTDPAEWFDVTDIGGELFDLTEKVIDNVL